MCITFLVVGFAGHSIIQQNRFNKDLSLVEKVLDRTMREAMTQGAAGQIRVANGAVAGQLMGRDGLWHDVAQATLHFAAFGRHDTLATPWLNCRETAATSYANHVIPITTTGAVTNSGAVFLSYSGYEASVELLESGAMVTFHREQGTHRWVR